MLDIKTDKERTYAVLIRQCMVTNAVDTKLFSDPEMARTYCNVIWGMKDSDWESYLIEPDPTSAMKYNDDHVRFAGWKAYIDETEQLLIHLERLVIEF